MKSIADINAIREQMQSKVLIRDNTKEGETHVFVAMGTVGLESGAVEVFNAFVDEISSRLIKNVRISRVGALSDNAAQPTAQVVLPGQAPVTYVALNADKVKVIVDKHILGGAPVADYLAK